MLLKQVYNCVVKKHLSFYLTSHFCQVKLKNILVQTICSPQPATSTHCTVCCNIIAPLCTWHQGAVLTYKRIVEATLDSIANRFLIQVFPSACFTMCPIFSDLFPWCMHLCHHAMSHMQGVCENVLIRQNQNVSILYESLRFGLLCLSAQNLISLLQFGLYGSDDAMCYQAWAVLWYLSLYRNLLNSTTCFTSTPFPQGMTNMLLQSRDLSTHCKQFSAITAFLLQLLGLHTNAVSMWDVWRLIGHLSLSLTLFHTHIQSQLLSRASCVYVFPRLLSPCFDHWKITFNDPLWWPPLPPKVTCVCLSLWGFLGSLL